MTESVEGELESVIDVNGRMTRVRASAATTLLAGLRDHVGLTGTKFNCEQGECGACTVLLDGQPVNACLVLVASAHGHSVTTVEGVGASERPSAIQDAFMRCDASQCGYCTPGMVVSASALLARTERPTRAEIAQALAGNYCRCTGYESIVNAIAAAAGDREESS
jgi:aerobic-type carbon monoxide dehydrogenase small subunit (CoxS/CutS family)